MQHDPEVRRICATAYLDHLKSLKGKIDFIKEDIELLRDIGGTAMSYRERVASSPNPKAFEDRMASLDETRRRWDLELAEFADELDMAHDVFLRMSSREGARALKSHYLLGRSWEMVCVEMGYSYSGMMKLRHRAIDEVYDLMPERWRRETIPNAAA